MRRANVECTMVGMDKLEVTSSHQIKIKMDQIYDGLITMMQLLFLEECLGQVI